MKRRDVHRDIALETDFDGALVDAMSRRAAGGGPGCAVRAVLLSGGTDDKSFAMLGIRCFGFAPLRLPPDLDFAGHVPRRRRAGAGRGAEVRRPGARPLPRRLLTPS